MPEDETRSHTDALSFKDRILNQRVRGRGKRVKANTAVEAPIVLPKLKFRKMDADGELVALWLLSTGACLAGGLVIIASPPVGISILAVGGAGFLAYLLGCRWSQGSNTPEE